MLILMIEMLKTGSLRILRLALKQNQGSTLCGACWLTALCLIALANQGFSAEKQPAASTHLYPAASMPVEHPPGKVVEKGDSIMVGDKITASKSRRTISIPAWVNQREGVIEYALVMRAGKTHESLFATDADAKDLHVTALLFRVSPVAIVEKETEEWVVPAASAVGIRASWRANDEQKDHELSDLVVLRDPKADNLEHAFPAGPWLYNGSRLIETGAFLAQTGGSIISMIFDPDALINNSHIDRTDDNIHAVKTSLLPPLGTPVTITFQLNTNAVVLESNATNRAPASTREPPGTRPRSGPNPRNQSKPLK
jgi:hypothetical protein